MTQEKGPGRPSKITPEITEEICDYIKSGNYPETAAALAGIHRATFYRWIKKGNQHKTGLHREFCDRIKEAEAYAQGAAVERIRAAGDKNWQALAWWLERKFPELWGRRQRVELEHSGEIKQEVKVSIHDRIQQAQEYFDELDESREGSDNGDDNQ